MSFDAVARRLLSVTNDMTKALSRLHREKTSSSAMVARLLAKLYPRTAVRWSGRSAATLDVADLLVPNKAAEGDKPVSPYDFACAFMDPASTTARLTSIKPPVVASMVELTMIGVDMTVEPGEIPPLEGLTYADAMRLVLAGALGKMMLDDPAVAEEYANRQRLVEG